MREEEEGQRMAELLEEFEVPVVRDGCKDVFVTGVVAVGVTEAVN